MKESFKETRKSCQQISYLLALYQEGKREVEPNVPTCTGCFPNLWLIITNIQISYQQIDINLSSLRLIIKYT